jgi:hypothetical protein
VLGAGAHEDAEEARARAEVALANAVWGPVNDRPRTRPPPALFRPAKDPGREVALDDGRTAVLLAVKREEVAARVETWLDETVRIVRVKPADTPAARLAAAVAAGEAARVEAFACQRLAVVAKVLCDNAPIADSPLALLATEIRLEPAIDGGIPRVPGLAPLRPAAACARHLGQTNRPQPWPDLPLRFVAPVGMLAASTATTGANGCAQVAFVASPPDALVVRVEVDAEQLLGDLAADWPGVATELRLRPIVAKSARVIFHLFELVMERNNGDQITAESAAGHLATLGYSRAGVLPEAVAAALEVVRGGTAQQAAELLESADAGRADILVVGSVHSEFLSRAIGRTLWHEATLRAEAVNVWSGKSLGTIELSMRAQGLGDDDAARNAMRALGNTLAARVAELLTKSELSAVSANLR